MVDQRRDFGVAVIDGQLECGVTIFVRSARVRAGVEQQLHDPVVALLGGRQQRVRAELIRSVDVDDIRVLPLVQREQELDDFLMSVVRSDP